MQTKDVDALGTSLSFAPESLTNALTNVPGVREGKCAGE
jgi:hypothetical protein